MERENASRSIETYIPHGIIEEILSRLPVKSLLKFRCVSKSWRSLIGSKRFIKIHLQNSTKNTSLSHHRMICSLVEYPQTRIMQCSWISLLNEPVVGSYAFDDLFNIHCKSIKIVGCCDGLVCFLLNRNTFFLWNPSTRVLKKLPDPVDIWCDNIISYGFGYDESSNDYKVVGINFLYMIAPNKFITKVFSLKTNSWKTLTYEDDSLINLNAMGKFASGNLHWDRAAGRGDWSWDWEIVSFDLKCEAFKIVECPSYPEGPIYQSVGVIEGCLSVLCNYSNSHSDIWVMKQYGVKESWVKVVTLPRHQFAEVDIYNLFFSRGPNGEIVQFYRSGVLIYYPNDNRYRYFPVHIMHSVDGANCYIESLVPLDSDAEQDRKIVILWNPATRISKKLLDPFHGIQRNVGCGNPSIYNNYQVSIFTKHGLGYDESSDDYKVVLIGVDAIYHISRIYSLKTNSWKTFKDKDVPSYNFQSKSPMNQVHAMNLDYLTH